MGARKKPYVYFVRAGDCIKTGFSTHVRQRMRSLQVDSSERLVILGVIRGGRSEEQQLHGKFSAHRIRGEWFYPHRDLLSFIRENAATLPDGEETLRLRLGDNARRVDRYIDHLKKLTGLDYSRVDAVWSLMEL